MIGTALVDASTGGSEARGPKNFQEGLRGPLSDTLRVLLRPFKKPEGSGLLCGSRVSFLFFFFFFFFQ